ncbi:tetratricopeptide repeat protein [Kovacikia minuta CCNUW1]|uniref:O-linked N-acetylglucosamine transferase family protein n=1 Tax=Kovacikia minuta TaxID=2931930 RepID=UPI001CCD5F10|nr:tetratricopeptide repeat protein [Kovacikia minuta]UBF28430.1 tetratricopeptide repeat protein [Kovacikia minuta CCNUW1]
MDYRRFIAELPSFYNHWGQESVVPKSELFQATLQRLTGMTTANVTQLLNFAVECMEPGEVYCEVGCFQGSTLVGALLNHPDRAAYAVDNFSEFDPEGENLSQLLQNLAAFGMEDQVLFCNQDFEEFFADLRELRSEDRIGVYLYDGAHDYRSQLMGLLLAKPFLADRALIVVDDSNWEGVQQANWDFIAAHPQCDLLLDLPTPGNGHPTFWNGVQVLSWDATASHNHDWSSLKQQRKIRLIQAIYDIPASVSVLPGDLETLQQEAQRLQVTGQLEAAEHLYLVALQQDANRADSWHGLGIVYYLLNQSEKAFRALSNALKIDSAKASYHYSAGLLLEKMGKPVAAAEAYQQTIALDPAFLDAYTNLGNLVAEQGDPHQAELIYQTAIAQDPRHVGSYLNRGNLFLVQGKVEQAIADYQTALEIDPDHADLRNNLIVAQELAQNAVKKHQFAGDNLHARRRYQEAASHYQALLEQQQLTAEGHLALADCYEKLKQYDAALQICQQGIDRQPSVVLYTQLIRVLQETGQTETAIAIATRAAREFPDEQLFRFQQHLLLPVLYPDFQTILRYQDHYTRGLNALLSGRFLATESAKKKALTAIEQFNNFFLICQNANHRDSQQAFGQLVHQIMAANYPEWTQPLPMPPVEDKIRIGYVSGCLWQHTVGKLMVGWFRHHDRDRFQIHTYHISENEDDLTQEIQQHSHVFYAIPDDLEGVSRQIRADQLHILVFLDLGMQTLMSRLAALRLAPVQCTTWAHPITSGLSTVDYFLSSDLMEPENAQDHYSEELIRLPNLAIAFAEPQIPPPTKPRSAFQLREDAIVYLACQTLIKYLPEQDAVFAAIAQQVPHAQFVFVARPNAPIAKQFRQRLNHAFAQVGLDSAAYCVMLPPLNQADYWNLNQVSDVFLDSFGWSGGHTTLEAIACHLPVVTLPGELMRGRHSYAILKMLGVTDTIAQTRTDYIEIAVRLGCDRPWSQNLIQRMIDQSFRLYDDKTCMAALEAFYQRIVRR